MSLTEGKLPQNPAEPADARPGRKRALIVSFYWPPSGGGGVQRWLKFAKLLPEHGWDPIVVTPSNPDVPVTDPSLQSEVSNHIDVWTFPIWEPSRVLRALGVSRPSSRLGSDGGRPRSLLGRLVLWVRGNVFVPDARVGWVRPTTQRLLQKLQDTPVDVIVTTGPPHSMHLIGLALKRATGLPWVADFRDPWSTMDYLDDFALSPKTRRRIQNLEREVVQTADRVVVTSRGALRELGVAKDGHGVVLPNGWDRDDFPATRAERPRNQTPVLGHFGALYGARNPSNLWPALANSSWSFRAGGPISSDILQNIEASGVPFEWQGDLPHQEAIQAMLECDALLIAHNNSASARASTPGKVFECLATGLPLLVIGPPESDLAALCESWGVAFFDHDDDPARILAWLKNPTPAPAQSLKNAFERHSIATELASVLHTLVSS